VPLAAQTTTPQTLPNTTAYPRLLLMPLGLAVLALVPVVYKRLKARARRAPGG
jgi:hypothetical protein